MAWDAGAFEYGASPTEVPGPTTPPSVVPPETPPIAGTGSGDEDVLPSQGIPIRATGGATFILGKIYLDTGTEYEASRVVVHPDYIYEARILSWGFVDRSIPVPSGLPQLGDCRIRLADTDRKFRDLVPLSTWRRRLIEMRMVPEGGNESDYPPFATFEIVDAEFTPGAVEITGRDINFTWIDKRLPGLINRTNFPDLMDGIDEAFCPIIQGINIGEAQESPPIPQGCIPLPRMTLTRWGVAQHPIESVLAVYRRLPGEGAFTLISSSDYTVTTAAPQIFDDIEYTMTFLDFDVDQDDGAEVRIDAEGVNARGPFGSMPAVSGSVLRNPIDFLINMLYAVTVAEPRIAHFNIDSFDEVRTKCEEILGGSPVSGYLCDGCIVEPITIREFLSQFLTSFEMDLYVNRYGELEVNLTTTLDADRPVFSDGPVFGEATDSSLIKINSVRQRLANPTVNRLRFNYALNYATNEFASKQVMNNVDDQLALGGDFSPIIPEIEEDIVEFRFIRDPDTAEHVARRRLEFLALRSYRIELQLPLPEVTDDLELAKIIGVTHYGGLALGGFHNQPFKVTGLTYDLDRLAATVRAIIRACCPLPRAIGAIFPGDQYSWSHNSRVGPFMASPSSNCEISQTFVGIFRDSDNLNKLIAIVADDMGASWGTVDEDGFETLEHQIVSHDTQPNEAETALHVATQEIDGRVSYHTFSLISKTWTSVNEIVNQPAVVTEAPGFAFAPIGNSAKIGFSSITLGATTTLFGWYKLYTGNPLNNYNPIWGSDGSNEIYYGSGVVSGKVEIVKGGSAIFRSSNSVVADEWHFLIIVDDGAAIKAYYDDVDMGNVIGGYTSLSGMSITRSNQGQNGNNFRGWMDEIGIFNRALSTGEATALYNSGSGVYGDISISPFNSALTLGYHVDEGSGTTTADYSGNGRTGTVTWESGPGWAEGVVTVPDSVLYDAHNMVDGAVSIDIRSGGDIVIAYDSTRENVSGTDYARCLMRIRSGGSWSTAFDIARTGEAQNSLLSRVVTGLEDRIHIFTSVSPGFFVPSTPDLEFQTMLGDNSLGAITTWHFSGLSGNLDRFYIGTPDKYTIGTPSGDDYYISLPIRVGGEGSVTTFIDDDVITPTIPGGSFPLIWYGSDSSLKPSYAVKYTDALHEIWLDYALASPIWINYDDLQAGPVMPVGTPRELDANLWLIDGVNWLGTFLMVGGGIKFELLDTTTLPTSGSLLMADWEAALEDQITTIETDCD